jgi:hypothetical protein
LRLLLSGAMFDYAKAVERGRAQSDDQWKWLTLTADARVPNEPAVAAA